MEKPHSLHVGSVQLFSTLDIQENLKKIELFIKQAAGKGVELLLFPECALSGYAPTLAGSHSGFTHDETSILQAMEQVQQFSARYRVAVAMGTPWYVSASGWMNSVVLVDREGNQAGRVDKVFLFGDETALFRPGVLTDPIELLAVKLGIGICFDLRFPELWRHLALRGADVFLNPQAGFLCAKGLWKVPVISAHLRSRAAENQRFMVSANCVPVSMATSEIFDPAGLCLASANPESEEMIDAILDIKGLEGSLRHGLADFLEILRTGPLAKIIYM
jgi:predicted amidohydrolase